MSSTPPYRVKCTLWNDTDFDLVPTGKTLNFKVDRGSIEGASAPPSPIPQRTKAEFTLVTPDGSLGPDAWVVYELTVLKIVLTVIVRDPSSGDEPVRVVENRLEGASGEIDWIPVAFTDDSLRALDVSEVNSTYRYTATITLRLKPDSWKAAAPAQTTVVTTPLSATPGNAGSVSVPGPIYRWDDPRIDKSPKRKKLLAIIGNLFPLIYMPEGTTYSMQEPVSGAAYRKLYDWKPGKGTSCTSVNTKLQNLATNAGGGHWAFGAMEFKAAWVPWGTDPTKPMPSVGDIYILYRDVVENVKAQEDTDHPHLRHCGVILQVPKAPGEKWVTADGGQTIKVSGDAAYLNARPWEKRLPKKESDEAKQKIWENAMTGNPWARPIDKVEYIFMGGGAESSSSDLSKGNRLLGWLDLDSPAITFKPEALDRDQAHPRKYFKYTNADYLALGAWIDKIAKR